MSHEVDDLKDAVTAETSVNQAAIALLNGLAAKIEALPADAAAIAELAATVKANTQSLSDAVTANTPAAG